MKIGPDGSLPRITSSAKDLRNNVRIVKVPDSVPCYKLVVIKAVEEESSEKSSDEDDLSDDLFDKKNIVKEKIDNLKQTHNQEKRNNNEADRGKVKREHNHYNRHRQYYNKHNRYHGRRNNSTFNKFSKHYKNQSNMREIYNYGNRDLNSATNRNFNSAASGRDINFTADGRDINSVADSRDINSAAGTREFNSAIGNRNFNSSAGGQDFSSSSVAGYNFSKFTSTPNQDFNSTADHHASFDSDNYQHPSNNFEPSPWLDIQPSHLQYSHTPFPPHVPLPGLPRSSLGLLGDRPAFAPPLPVFQTNSPNDNFACNQTAPYPSMTSNFTPNHNSFVPNQNSMYSQKTSNYPSSKKSNNFPSDKNYRNDSYGNYRKDNRPRNKHMNDNNTRKQDSWNKGPRRHPNERSNKSYEYRK